DSYLAGGRVFGAHATFKRYLATIPPPAADDGDGVELGNFKAWINARVLASLSQAVSRTKDHDFLQTLGDLGLIDWQGVVAILETTYRNPSVVSEHLSDMGLKPHVFAGLQGYTYTQDLLLQARARLDVDLLVLFL